MIGGRTGRNLGWTTIALLGSKGAMLLSTVLIARAISPSQFGDYIVAVAMAALLMPVLDAGFFSSVTRAASRRGDVPALSFTATAARMRLPLWGGTLALGVLGGVLGVTGHMTLVLLAILSAIGQAQLDTMSGELRALGRYRLAAGREASSGCVAIVGSLTLLVLGGNDVDAMAVFAAARVIPALIFLPLIPIARPDIKHDIPWRIGLTMGITGILIALYVRSDMLLLSWFRIDPTTVARYGVAYSLVIAFQLVPIAISTTIFPQMASGTTDDARALAAKGLSLSFLVSAVLCAVCFLSPRLVFAPFGSAYTEHASQVAPLLLIILPISLSQVATTTLQARNRENLMLRFVATIAAVNIGLNFILIPILGVKGALIATMSGELCAAVLTLIALQRFKLGSAPLAFLPAVTLVLILGIVVAWPVTVSIALIASGLVLWRANVLSVRLPKVSLLRRGTAASAA